MQRIIAMLPTYNEAENIGPLIDAILAKGDELEALVVDDNSPDGTWRQVRALARANPRVHLLHRTKARGRGLAGIAGFREALRLGADYVIEMDADWSHDPKWIPELLERARRERDPVDIVIGSRLVPGGGEEGRPRHRQWITALANLYIRLMLGFPVRDATSGYRVFSRRCLEAIPWEAMRARGPEVVQEVLVAAQARGFRMAEVPIIFVERRHGQSTFNGRIMLRSLTQMARLRWAPGGLVQQHEDGALTRLPTFVTWPASQLYGLGRRLDRARRTMLPGGQRKLLVPVVCIGNMTVGGTGKTPMVRHVAEILKGLGHHPAVLSRGYAAEERPDRPLLVGDGERVLARPELAGDEPTFLAEHLKGVPVLVHPDRHAAGELALKMFNNDLLILDDGFQHDQLARELDLVLWDVRDLPRRMRIIPAGRMREGLSALRRASAVILTHAEYLPEAERPRRLREVLHQLKHASPTLTIFEAETLISGWTRLSGAHGESTDENPEPGKYPWTGRVVVAISGLARPSGFEAMLKSTGALLAEHLRYPDHFQYGWDELDHWRHSLERHNASMLLTTEKDAVKIAGFSLGGLPLMAIGVQMRVTEPERFAHFLTQRLAR